jgi:hypothetical protein
MSDAGWPDPLQSPDPARVEFLLSNHWNCLDELGHVCSQREWLLAESLVTSLRLSLIELMLALNGISYPQGTQHLNSYLGDSQRRALERTLVTLEAPPAGIVGRAVAITVIYRWYAPQLCARWSIAYPTSVEERVWPSLMLQLPGWPNEITSDD